jgi:hypothetical protein
MLLRQLSFLTDNADGQSDENRHRNQNRNHEQNDLALALTKIHESVRHFMTIGIAPCHENVMKRRFDCAMTVGR